MATPTLMEKARVRMLLQQPFFASLALTMPMVETEEHETFATDGASIFWNPKFAAELSADEVVGVLAHEVMHCALQHQTRRGNRDPGAWNVACDFAINPILIAAGITLPKGGLNDPKYAGMSAEAIYATFPPGGGAGMGGGGYGAGGFGQVLDAPAADGRTDANGKPAKASPAEMTRQAEDWEIKVAQAARAAAGQGRLPAGLEKFAKELLQPSVDWRQELRRFVNQISQDDYAWSPPNRRYVSQGLYLPSRHSERMGPLVLARDTSGSIYGSPALLAQFNSEISAIIEETRPSIVHLLDCDAKVQRVAELTVDDMPLSDHVLTARGGGGTAFEPVFDWVAKREIEPCCAIYLTDLDGSFPKRAPDYPVLWASFGRTQVAPFGEVLKVEII